MVLIKDGCTLLRTFVERSLLVIILNKSQQDELADFDRLILNSLFRH